MKKWLTNRWINLNLEKEVHNEHEAEVMRLQAQIAQLDTEFVPLSQVIYGSVIAMTCREDRGILSTQEGTFAIKIADKTEFKALINRLIPKELKNLEVSYEDKTCRFYLKLFNTLIARYLPTSSFMRVVDNGLVEIELDFKELVNLNDIRNFADVVIGRLPITEDEVTYRNVFKASLRDLSTRYGLELVSDTLDTIDFDTPMHTQIVIRPNDDTKHKPLRICLEKFYQDSGLREEVKEYIDNILTLRQDNRTIDRAHTIVTNYLTYNKLIDEFYFYITTVNDKMICELHLKGSRGIKPLLIDLGSFKMPSSATVVRTNIERQFSEQIRAHLQQRMTLIYNKYKDRILVPYTKRIMITGVHFKYMPGIDAEILCSLSDFDLVLKWYEIELQLLIIYGVRSTQKLTFQNVGTTNVLTGVIGGEGSSQQILSYFLKPFQAYQQFKFITEQPTVLDDVVYNWCNYTQKTTKDQVEVTLDNYPNLRIDFTQGYRSNLSEIFKNK